MLDGDCCVVERDCARAAALHRMAAGGYALEVIVLMSSPKSTPNKDVSLD
jgi:hypothetical protein